MVLAAVCLMQASCATHYYNVREEREAPVLAKRLESPINRAPADPAGRVLVHSGIATFRGYSRPPAKAHDLGETTPAKRPRLALYTAGLWPAKTPASRTLRLVEKTPARDKVTDYQLQYVKRVSIWERFRFLHDDERVLGRALAWSYAKDRRAHTPARDRE
ncbi:hypothetical protein [Luteolibacter sp. LG18]|uniref:hypothetical protein n=1 Tax=Luteolibacter sp. LG18 TaxID=2819286 RepID=UPI002B31A3EB|nr:hypothetical protein llg_30760 [Luteolibacter sp. LG18]